MFKNFIKPFSPTCFCFAFALFLKTTLENSLIKGIRGGNIILPCSVPNSSSDQLPTISWQKSTGYSSTVSFATSFNGVSQIKYVF